MLNVITFNSGAGSGAHADRKSSAAETAHQIRFILMVFSVFGS